MLETLRNIVQDVNAAPNFQRRLDIIVARVKDAMGTEVCSIYLMNPARTHYLFVATEGLNIEAVGKARLAIDEGLVGLVAQRA